MTTCTPIPGPVLRVGSVDWRAISAADVGLGGMVLALGFWAVVAFNTAVVRNTPLATLLAIVATFCIADVVHECGHAAAACLLGHQVVALRAGPLSLTRRNDGWVIRLDWRQCLGSGAVTSLPPRQGARRWRLVAIFAAGPITHLAAIVWLAFGWRFWLRVAPEWCFPVLFVSMACLAINLAPHQTGLMVSDGARLLQLSRSDAAAAHCAALELFGRAYRGELGSNLDPALADLAATCGPYALDRYGGNLLAYGWAAACGDWKRAETYLESALAAAVELPLPKGAQVFHTVALVRVSRRNGVPRRVWLERVRQLQAAERTN